MTPAVSPSAPVDLTRCDREPIHIPGHIQPHGCLLALATAGLEILQVSANLSRWTGRTPERLLGQPVEAFLGPANTALLQAAVRNQRLEKNPLYIGSVTVPLNGLERGLRMIGHSTDGMILLELEPAPTFDPVAFHDVHSLLSRFISKLQGASSTDELCRLAAEEVRGITGFDRVLVYRFDDDGNGTVLAEDRNDLLPSYLGLRFPASDIPKQARALYQLNRLRLIPTAHYEPVPLLATADPRNAKPLDLSYAALRSVSPVHLEYMRNMGTEASMSISILREGVLWGLISCHHKTSRHVPFEVRAACDFLGQVLSMQLSARTHADEAEYRLGLTSIQTDLLASMAASDNFIDGLRSNPDGVLRFADAQGAAVLFQDQCTLIGQTPTEPEVRAFVQWLTEHGQQEIFATSTLATHYPAASSFVQTASGVLAIAISKLHASYVLWFRPERVQTVRWGGDPRKPVEDGSAGTIQPRHSFEIWKETVRDTAEPWPATLITSATELRNAIVGIVLRKAEELAELSEELKRSNRELEAFSYSVSHDLRAPFRHIVGYSELLKELDVTKLGPKAGHYLDNIIESARFAGTLVDNLLNFSQIGRTSLALHAVNLETLAKETQRQMTPLLQGRVVTWRIGSLPTVQADTLLMRLVITNLISNALKYTRPRPEAVIEMGSRNEGDEWVVFVRDNGVGFDMKYVDKLFGVFQRLHRMEEFEGTGIGLANVRRIIGRHGGRTWAEGAVDQGATFWFSLPKETKQGIRYA